MKNITTNIAPWSIGTVVALGGVVIARLLSPEMESDSSRIMVAVLGRLIALTGLCIILFGIHRRIRGDQSAPTAHSENNSVCSLQ